MYIEIIVRLFEHIAANITVQNAGLGFDVGPEGEYNAAFDDVYYKLFVDDSMFLEYETKSVAVSTNVVFWVLAKYRHDEQKNRRIVEQVSICEATGRLVIHHLKKAAQCRTGFSVAAISGITNTHKFSDDTVGVRYEVRLESAAPPACEVIEASAIDVCNFLNTLNG